MRAIIQWGTIRRIGIVQAFLAAGGAMDVLGVAWQLAAGH